MYGCHGNVAALAATVVYGWMSGAAPPKPDLLPLLALLLFLPFISRTVSSSLLLLLLLTPVGRMEEEGKTDAGSSGSFLKGKVLLLTVGGGGGQHFFGWIGN